MKASFACFIVLKIDNIAEKISKISELHTNMITVNDIFQIIDSSCRCASLPIPCYEQLLFKV